MDLEVQEGAMVISIPKAPAATQELHIFPDLPREETPRWVAALLARAILLILPLSDFERSFSALERRPLIRCAY
jgi:hypothetical protein